VVQNKSPYRIAPECAVPAHHDLPLLDLVKMGRHHRAGSLRDNIGLCLIGSGFAGFTHGPMNWVL